jgi:peptide/nickel transport system substrate-binding protein
MRLHLDVVKGNRISWMRIEKPTPVSVYAYRPLEFAVVTATVNLMDCPITEHQFLPSDAYCFVSTYPDFRIIAYLMCRLGNVNNVAAQRLLTVTCYQQPDQQSHVRCEWGNSGGGEVFMGYRERGPLSRRELLTLATGGAAALFSRPILALAAPKAGGSAVVAMQGHVTSLDWQITNDEPSRNVNSHLYELLVTRDENMKPIPDLAESWRISPDGKLYTFVLRQEVLFHNGKELTSADAKASLERYGRIAPDKAILGPVDSIALIDKYTLQITLKRAVPTFIEQLSSPRNPAAIIPAEDADKQPGKSSFVGTGPYQFDKSVPDSYVSLRRFDRYKANMNYTKRDGFGGKKTAYLDVVTFRVVPESGARVAGLQTGEYDLADNIPVPVADRLASDSKLKVYRVLPWGMLVEYVNCAFPPTNSLDVRRAIQAALNVDQISKIATDGLYQLDSGYQYAKFPYYVKGPGNDLYDQRNLSRAKELLAKAGYHGEMLTLVTNSDFEHLNKTTIVIGDQLRAIGMSVDIKVYDWPTSLAKLNDTGGWNLWSDSLGLAPSIGDAIGVMRRFTGKENFQKSQDGVLDDLFAALTSGPTLVARREAFRKMQARVYDQVYAIRLGDEGYVQASRSWMNGFVPYRVPRMWDVWVSK